MNSERSNRRVLVIGLFLAGMVSVLPALYLLNQELHVVTHPAYVTDFEAFGFSVSNMGLVIAFVAFSVVLIASSIAIAIFVGHD